MICKTHSRLTVLLLSSMALFGPAVQAALTLDAATTINPLRVSEPARIEYTVSNTDGFARNDVVMTLVYPTSLNAISEANFDGDCPSTTCTPGETVTWTLGSIPAGGSTTVLMAPIVSPTAVDGETISLVATVTDSSLDTDMATTDLIVDLAANYDLALSESHDPATPGSTLIYQIDFGFRDDAASVTNSTLSFNVPSNATFVSASDGGSLGGSTVTWPLGFLSPGDSGLRSVEVTLSGGLQSGDTVTASASLTAVSDPGDSVTALSTTSISASDGLQLAIENNRDQARSSGAISYLLTVTNNDPFTRFGVQIVADYPYSLSALSEANFEGDCGSTTCTSGERVTWTVGDIPAGGTRRFEMPVFVLPGSSSGELINFDVTAVDVAGLQTRESEVVRINNNTLYEVILSDSSEPSVAGSDLTYRLDFAYRGDAASVNNTELVLSLPTGVIFSSASDGGTLNGSEVSWPLGFLSPGDGGTRFVDVAIDNGLTSGSVLNAQATVGSLTNPVQFALSEVNTAISSTSGLQVAVESSSNPAQPSTIMNYQLVVSNTDPFTRFGVDLTLIYPFEFSGISEANFDGDCGSTTCTGSEIVTWTLGSIPAGGVVTVDLPSTISSTALDGRLVPLRAIVEDDQGAQALKTETVRIQDDSRFELSLSDNSDPVTAGSELVYTVKFGYLEDSASVVQNELVLHLPPSVTFISGSNGAVHSNGEVTWNLGFMNPGDGGQRKVKVAVDGTIPNTNILSAVAEITSVSSPLERTRAEQETIVDNSKGLLISMVSNPDTIRSGELSNYQISVINTDPFTRFGVDLKGIYPQGTNATAEGNFQGDCVSTTCTFGELTTWMLGDIRSGESKTVNLPAPFATLQTGGSLVEFRAEAVDDQGVQSRQTAALRVQNDTVYDVSVDPSADPVAPGSSLSYRITYGYRDDAGQVSNTGLRFPIPDGATFVSATGGGVLTGGAVEWALGNLSPGEGGVVEVTVLVGAGAVNGAVISTAAELFSNSLPFEVATGETASIVLNDAPLDLDALALTFTAAPSRELAVIYTVTNNDVFTRFGVTLNARMPQGFSNLAESDPDFNGDCPSTTCSVGELIVWPIGDLGAGQSVSVLLPPKVLETAVDGDLLPFSAWVSDQQDAEARASVSIYTGCLNDLDTDCDGVANTSDNCSLLANTPQRDTDGDGFGNRCDPDLNNDMTVNFIDISLFSGLFLSTDEDADFNGDGSVNFLDYAILTGFFLSPPGPGADTD